MYVVDVDMIKCRRCSSVVEHVIGNDGVVSPILISGTNARNPPLWRVFALVIGGRSGLTMIASAIRKSGADIAERS